MIECVIGLCIAVAVTLVPLIVLTIIGIRAPNKAWKAAFRVIRVRMEDEE